jgi:hypothetical protein
MAAKEHSAAEPQPKMIAAKGHKKRIDTNSLLCVSCVLSRQKSEINFAKP